MTPGARVQAVVDLTEALGRGGAADAVASHWFRARRFVGAKDRADIARRFYGLLRRRARGDWWIARALDRRPEPPPPPRFRVLADLVLADRATKDDIFGLFDGGPHRPAPLSRAERELVDGLAGQPLDHPDMPGWVRNEHPVWFQPASTAAAAALNREAPLDLRVNPLRGDRAAALNALKAAGIQAEATALSPLGLRVRGRPALGALPAFRDGLVEVQDEGSQIVALLVDARPGQAVVDYCAGAGGKTLALAGAMANKGRLIAADLHEARLDRAVTRLRRAGVHNVERRAIDADNAGWFKRQAGRFDRVLVDAPCSGTGTWRRNPDMKWRIGPDDIAELVAIQGDILARAALLVRPGGRLIYATCSSLTAENEDVVTRFLAVAPDFRPVDVTALWPETVGGACPVLGPWLRLTPETHETDGFFAAVLTRVAGEEPTDA